MKYLLLSITSLMVLYSCSSQTTDTGEAVQPEKFAVADSTADFLQMAHDHKGNVLAWWVQTDHNSGEDILCWAQSSGDELSFSKAQCIAATKGLSAHSEGLPKLAVKPSGTYVLVFGRSNDQSKKIFASSVVYIQSFDEGKSWTEPQLVHSDTNPDNSHAFATAVLLPNGEVGAAWLDGRNHLEHSELYFVQTQGREGFGKDKHIGGPSCQCCKLNLYMDDDQTLHLVYRSLTGDNIRDIAHISSKDNGKSFSLPTIVSNDQWQINACPHNGPAITKVGSSLFTIWYTMGGGEGLYYVRSDRQGENFSSRTRLTEQAKRPYIASLGDQAIAVWDEVFQKDEEFYRRVKRARIDSKGDLIDTKYLSPEGTEATMPYLFEMDSEKVIVTWTQSTEGKNQLYFQRFD